MDLQKIKALIDLVARSSLSELELEEGESRLRIVRGETSVPGKAAPNRQPATDGMPVHAPTQTSPRQATPVTPVEGLEVKAPMFGVFRLTPAPGEAPFVAVGDEVNKGQRLCMLEAMKLFHSLEAPHDGKIAAILVENGQEVDAGQPLFRFE